MLMHHEQAVALLVLLKPLLTQADVRPLDIAPPTVAVVRSSAAKIKWKTPAWSDAAVEYGPTTRYGATERTRRHARIHRVALRGLEPGRTYHYRVSSRESDGAVVVSRDFVFTTPPTVAARAPARPAHSAGATSRSRSSS
jgi:phosphodiesterase/alkaline phosphatase D-like protein